MKKVKRILSIISIGLALLFLVGMVVLQQFALSGKESEIDSLKREKDQTRKSLLKAANENEEIRQTLRKTENAFSNYKNTAKTLDAYVLTNNVVDQENELDRWLGTILQLKGFIARHPEYAIPEFKYLENQDWLAVTEKQMETEADCRRALALLRMRSYIKTGDMLRQAVIDFTKANNGKTPQKYEDIIDYLPDGFDYTRYTDNPSGKISSSNPVLSSQQWIIKDVGAVDGIWDSGLLISAEGASINVPINFNQERVVRAAIEEYKNKNGGLPASSGQIAEYIKYTYNAKKMSKTEIDAIYTSITTPLQ